MAYLSGLAGIAKGEFEGWKYFVRVKGNPGNVNLYGHARVSREAEGTVVVEQELSNMWRPLSLRYEATSHEGSEKFLLAGGEYDLGSGRFFLMDMTSDSVQVRQISFPLTVSYRPGDYVAVRRTWKGGKERTHVHGFYRGDGHQHSELPGLKRAETIEVPGWNPEDDQHSEFPGLELARAMESAVTESRQFLSEGLNEVLTSHR
ncbi:MAG: hypothetical protein O7H41_02775 [Planctomycetota bacterium]|nr:hypothetical protein [Planctomycetota bacterium]